MHVWEWIRKGATGGHRCVVMGSAVDLPWDNALLEENVVSRLPDVLHLVKMRIQMAHHLSLDENTDLNMQDMVSSHLESASFYLSKVRTCKGALLSQCVSSQTMGFAKYIISFERSIAYTSVNPITSLLHMHFLTHLLYIWKSTLEPSYSLLHPTIPILENTISSILHLLQTHPMDEIGPVLSAIDGIASLYNPQKSLWWYLKTLSVDLTLFQAIDKAVPSHCTTKTEILIKILDESQPTDEFLIEYMKTLSKCSSAWNSTEYQILPQLFSKVLHNSPSPLRPVDADLLEVVQRDDSPFEHFRLLLGAILEQFPKWRTKLYSALVRLLDRSHGISILLVFALFMSRIKTEQLVHVFHSLKGPIASQWVDSVVLLLRVLKSRTFDRSQVYFYTVNKFSADEFRLFTVKVTANDFVPYHSSEEESALMPLLSKLQSLPLLQTISSFYSERDCSPAVWAVFDGYVNSSVLSEGFYDLFINSALMGLSLGKTDIWTVLLLMGQPFEIALRSRLTLPWDIIRRLIRHCSPFPLNSLVEDKLKLTVGIQMRLGGLVVDVEDVTWKVFLTDGKGLFQCIREMYGVGDTVSQCLIKFIGFVSKHVTVGKEKVLRIIMDLMDQLGELVMESPPLLFRVSEICAFQLGPSAFKRVLIMIQLRERREWRNAIGTFSMLFDPSALVHFGDVLSDSQLNEISSFILDTFCTHWAIESAMSPYHLSDLVKVSRCFHRRSAVVKCFMGKPETSRLKCFFNACVWALTVSSDWAVKIHLYEMIGSMLDEGVVQRLDGAVQILCRQIGRDIIALAQLEGLRCDDSANTQAILALKRAYSDSFKFKLRNEVKHVLTLSHCTEKVYNEFESFQMYHRLFNVLRQVLWHSSGDPFDVNLGLKSVNALQQFETSAVSVFARLFFKGEGHTSVHRYDSISDWF